MESICTHMYIMDSHPAIKMNESIIKIDVNSKNNDIIKERFSLFKNNTSDNPKIRKLLKYTKLT